MSRGLFAGLLTYANGGNLTRNQITALKTKLDTGATRSDRSFEFTAAPAALEALLGFARSIQTTGRQQSREATAAKQRSVACSCI